jgi:hypothetical protein
MDEHPDRTDVVGPTRWTGHLDPHVLCSREIATALPYFSVSFTLIHY